MFLPRYPCNDQIVLYDMRLQYSSKNGSQPLWQFSSFRLWALVLVSCMNLVRYLKPGPILSWLNSDLKSNFEITAQLFNWVLMTLTLVIGIYVSLIAFFWLSHDYSNPDTTISSWIQYQIGYPLCWSFMFFNDTSLFLIKYNKVQSS